jgi:hypothetical protein
MSLVLYYVQKCNTVIQKFYRIISFRSEINLERKIDGELSQRIITSNHLEKDYSGIWKFQKL